jgi:hypothetical protein
MHDTCPQCELKYLREDGYFFGAMYFSYALGILFALPTALVMFLNEFHVNWIAAVLLIQLTGLSPIIFRYSRVVWMHFDHKFDPPKRDQEASTERSQTATSETKQRVSKERRA